MMTTPEMIEHMLAEIRALNSQVAKIREEIGGLKVRLGLWSAAVAAIVALATVFVKG